MEQPNSNLSSEEKRKLKEQIFSSINRHKRKRRLATYLPVAASITLILAFYYISFHNSSPWFSDSLDKSRLVDLSANENITLVLSNEEKITVDKDSVNIVHQGDQIQIQDSKLIKQAKEQLTYNTLLVPHGKRSQLTLSDGTVVIVNSGSRVIYPSHFIGGTREVFLEGEAIFKVTEDPENPFIVLSDNHKIRVLGTEFNVTNYPEDASIKTVLKSGKVAIYYHSTSFFESEKTINIEPGTMADYHKEEATVTTEEIDIEPYFSWERGVLIFRNDPMETIMRKLARYYGCEIIIQNEALKNEKFSGYLDLKESVEKVLTNIQETTDFEYGYSKPSQIVIQ